MASSEFTFSIKRTALDENYVPTENTRITTNFANLARGESRQENLRNTLRMIDNRFNSLAHWGNPRGSLRRRTHDHLRRNERLAKRGRRRLPAD